MSRMSKDDYYMGIAEAVSKRSTCLKRRYGCVIVNNDEIIATGYNGNPRGLENCCDRGYCNRLDKPSNTGDYSDCYSVHAEQNAMLSASRRDMIGATMYLYGEEFKVINDFCLGNVDSWVKIDNPEPCPICERMIINAGIKCIVNSKGKTYVLYNNTIF